MHSGLGQDPFDQGGITDQQNGRSFPRGHVILTQFPRLLVVAQESPTMATYNSRPSPSAFTTPASTTLFRRLTWEGTIPLEIRVDSKELPANSDRGLECYYIQAPRVSYLPLLVPEVKKFLMDVVFDEAAARVVKEEDWWFESEEGALLKWCV